MMPDEKKPIPWGLPPLRSEVLARQAAAAVVTASDSSNPECNEKANPADTGLPEYFPEPMAHYTHGGPPGYKSLMPRSDTLSVSQRAGVFLAGATLLAGTAFYVGFGGCLMSRDSTSMAEGARPCVMRVVEELVQAGLNTSNTVAWDRLAEMTDLYGHRMTASEAYDRSAAWVVRTANEKDANLTAYTEPVWVDEWKRGSESLRLFAPTRPGGQVQLQMLGLGNSVGTPPDGIDAAVIPVHSFEELAQLGNATIAGNVVLYNFPFTGYGKTARMRSQGAREAEKYGAQAVLVRTLTPDTSFHSVHTGSSARATIPTAAISLADANMIERMYERAKAGTSHDHVYPRVKLVMNAQLRENAKQSANVIIDLKGSELPDEVVLLSGHFDSWDVGVGAMDDGAGAFLAWEAARMIASTGWAPRRTIRVVMWNNEETLQRGSKAYFEKHKHEIKNHRFAVESDIGVFEPWGLAVAADDNLIKIMKAYGANLLKQLGGGNVTSTELESPGEDIALLCKNGVPCAGFLSVNPENGAAPGDPHWEDHYFRYHHANSDRVEIIDKHQLRRSAASLAAWAYLIADF
ncbi:hypothetical protein IWW50_001300 [Coemansia erecta]|nr:hypothetical protein GGF43_003723 [Coemansia sp. RSA 2618]KAJ2828600.1 hypothetical protein IWW50_001300 [Coemansia erecta]